MLTCAPGYIVGITIPMPMPLSSATTLTLPCRLHHRHATHHPPTPLPWPLAPPSSLRQPLDKMEKAELRKQAAAFVDPGYSLVMAEKVDPALIGGFVLEFEDRLVDMSAAKKLQEFNDLVFKLESDLAQ